MMLDNILEKKIPTLVEAIEKADPTSEEYNRLLTNFNSSMIIFSELKGMFARVAENLANKIEGENNNGTNN